ncbi:MAG: FimB/Mfa2 family fimbrial subunit [Tannerella sp.]|jgi:hypothetical protein|nr:FimB/Mfa2 family fimbrial subunit [Tannerella sp.]
MDGYKKIGLLLCLNFMLILQGCVGNGLDECPDAIRYSLAFKYTLHTDNYDRFYNDVDKLFVYAFDAATGVCVYMDTATVLAPFNEDYAYSLPLNVGNYDIIIWGWGHSATNLLFKKNTARVYGINEGITRGQTTINDARLLLEERNSDGCIDKTFYGEFRNVEVPAFVSRIDTVSLLNLANQIRIVIPDAKTVAEQDDLSLSIVGDNGAYLFNSGNNAPNIDATRGAVAYLPYTVYRTDSILLADPIYMSEPYTGSGRDSMLVVEISTLRLIQYDMDMELILRMGSREIKFSLIDLLKAGISSNIQYNLDKYDRWQISYNYKNTSVSVTINTMDWHVVYMPTDVGGIMQ